MESILDKQTRKVHLGAKPMFFTNPTFEDGRVLITVRKGIKWANEIGNTIECFPVGADPEREQGVCYAHVHDTKVMKICSIRDKDHQRNHDPNCRTYTDLLKALCEVYPDFSIDEMVTVVYLEKL